MCDRMFLMACGATDALVAHLSKVNSCISSEVTPLNTIKIDEYSQKTPTVAADVNFSAKPKASPVPNNCSQQPNLELLARLVDSSNAFPAFDANQREIINSIAAQARLCRLSMTTLPKTLYHPRGTTISCLKDILEERANAFDEGMKFAFQRIMLSTDSEGFEDNTVDKQLQPL